MELKIVFRVFLCLSLVCGKSVNAHEDYLQQLIDSSNKHQILKPNDGGSNVESTLLVSKSLSDQEIELGDIKSDLSKNVVPINRRSQRDGTQRRKRRRRPNLPTEDSVPNGTSTPINISDTTTTTTTRRRRIIRDGDPEFRRRRLRQQQISRLLSSGQLSLGNLTSRGGGNGRFSLYNSFGGNQTSNIQTTTTATTTTTTTTTTTITSTTTVHATTVHATTGFTNADHYNENGENSEEETEQHSQERPQSDQDTHSTSTTAKPDLHANNAPKEGDLRLVGGRTEAEGNIEIFHFGEWGSLCDDEFDDSEARIVCKQLGFPGSKRPTYSSQFGYGNQRIWMDNLYCYGTEDKIQDCRFDGWGINDCERTEAAGVQCKERPPPTTPYPTTTTPRPKSVIHHFHKEEFEIRLQGGRNSNEGQVEILLAGSNNWGPICGDGWSLREAMVVCRQLGLSYAQSAAQTNMFGGNNSNSQMPVLSGISCRGNEGALEECWHDPTNFCPYAESVEVAAVVCVDAQADLEPDLFALVTSVYLEDKPLFFLQCAMEENCLAREAYRIRTEDPNYTFATRRLLRFTASIANIGNADFLPHIPKTSWDWHACHQHYHSMETFAHFDIVDASGMRVAEGHKASFCLEDRECEDGVDRHYDCQNYGDQGITPGCKDIYHSNIDCQWIDVSELPLGTYTFKLAVNPEYKVAEQTFENNMAVCALVYTQQFARLFNCSLTRPY